MIDTSSSVKKHRTILKYIAIGLICLSFISLFLPAFKVSVIFANISVSMKESLDPFVFWFYVVVLAISTIIVLRESPVRSKDSSFAVSLIFTGALTTILPFIQMFILRKRVSSRDYSEISPDFGEIAKRLLTPSYAFVMMCLLGVGMVVVAIIYRYYGRVEETEKYFRQPDLFETNGVNPFEINSEEQREDYTVAVNTVETDPGVEDENEISPDLLRRLRFLLKFHTDEGLIDFAERTKHALSEKDRQTVEQILELPKDQVREAIRKIVEKGN